MDKRSDRGLSVGITTVVVMLVVIAMTIFALLSISTAKQEAKLANKYALAVSDYWAADCICTDRANALAAAMNSGADGEELMALADTLGVTLTRDGKGYIAAYTVPAGESTAISVRLALTSQLEILEWKQISTDDSWSPEDTIPVFRG